jgi:hypothetical protein
MISLKTTVLKWAGHLSFDIKTKNIVGTCAFKGPPGDGIVEIAQNSGGVREVIAHTLPEENASTKILRDNRFSFVGDVVDPDDGKVWLWKLML